MKIKIYGNNENKHNEDIIKVFNQHITTLECKKIKTNIPIIIIKIH
jgi:hypothetical protein